MSAAPERRSLCSAERRSLPPKPPDMRVLRRLQLADRRSRQAEWLREHGIAFVATNAGIDTAFAQARQTRNRAERVAVGDSSKADAERERRKAKRGAAAAPQERRVWASIQQATTGFRTQSRAPSPAPPPPAALPVVADAALADVAPYVCEALMAQGAYVALVALGAACRATAVVAADDSVGRAAVHAWTFDNFASEAADRGALRLLRWGRAQDMPCPWGEDTFAAAALNGRLDVLQWLCVQDPPCPWNRQAFASACGLRRCRLGFEEAEKRVEILTRQLSESARVPGAVEVVFGLVGGHRTEKSLQNLSDLVLGDKKETFVQESDEPEAAADAATASLLVSLRKHGKILPHGLASRIFNRLIIPGPRAVAANAAHCLRAAMAAKPTAFEGEAEGGGTRESEVEEGAEGAAARVIHLAMTATDAAATAFTLAPPAHTGRLRDSLDQLLLLCALLGESDVVRRGSTQLPIPPLGVESDVEGHAAVMSEAARRLWRVVSPTDI